MPRLFVIVALSGLLLVGSAIVGAVVREPPPEHLTAGEFVVMARAIGLAPGLSVAFDRESRLCGRPLVGDVDEGVRALDTDCRVSAQLADHIDALHACADADCARHTAALVVEDARASEAIERAFARNLSGDCKVFFDAEAQYGQDSAEAADRLLELPGEAVFRDEIREWRRADAEAAQTIEGRPVPVLLAACRPDR